MVARVREPDAFQPHSSSGTRATPAAGNSSSPRPGNAVELGFSVRSRRPTRSAPRKRRPLLPAPALDPARVFSCAGRLHLTSPALTPLDASLHPSACRGPGIPIRQRCFTEKRSRSLARPGTEPPPVRSSGSSPCRRRLPDEQRNIFAYQGMRRHGRGSRPRQHGGAGNSVRDLLPEPVGQSRACQPWGDGAGARGASRRSRGPWTSAGLPPSRCGPSSPAPS